MNPDQLYFDKDEILELRAVRTKLLDALRPLDENDLITIGGSLFTATEFRFLVTHLPEGE